MLARRIIACLDIDQGRVVKGVRFQQLRDAGDPVEQARCYDAWGADELVFLDISASHEGRQTTLETVRRVADCVFIPLTVGGGVRSVADMRALLLAGADKVSINSAAVHDPQLLAAGAERFGSQCMVLAIDARRVPAAQPLRWEVVRGIFLYTIVICFCDRLRPAFTCLANELRILASTPLKPTPLS